jgi:hypothetical protein
MSWISWAISTFRKNRGKRQVGLQSSQTQGEIASVESKVFWYVIEINSGRDKIFTQPIDPSSLAHDILGDQTTQSVFLVENDVEEVEVLAAKSLTYSGKNSIEPRIAMRVYPRHLDDLGVIPEKTDSGTRIAILDNKHFDLNIDKSILEKIIESIVIDFELGENRFRRISTAQIAWQLRKMRDNPESFDANQHKLKKQCLNLLADYEKRHPPKNRPATS